MSDETIRRPESSPEDMQNALPGGVPMGRWKEGLLIRWHHANTGFEVCSKLVPPHGEGRPGRAQNYLHGNVAHDQARSDEHVNSHSVGQR